MKSFTVNPIGQICANGEGFSIKIDEKYKPAMKGLDGFGYVQVFWWFDGCDNVESRNKLIEYKPYKKGPDEIGAFATRSPSRPNPIALTSAYVTQIDYENGIIGLAYIDAHDGTPVLDIKPYTPSIDRIKNAPVPDWCADWPDCAEKSGDFDWSKVFNFEEE